MTTTAAVSVTATPKAALRELSEHRHYAYRGCAPHPDNPHVTAANPQLPIDAFAAPDIDGGEHQLERLEREDAAIEVCVECPVMMLCHTYANTVDADGHLAEPYGVFGGERALERHKRLVARRHEVVAAAPDARFDTPQKRAVLRAIAAHTDPYAIAAAAGMDVRTANWQRSNLVTLLGLKRTASRNELLDAAAARGLLEGITAARDDGSVPAVAPPTRMPFTAKPAARTTRRAPSPAPAPVLVPAVPAPQRAPQPATASTAVEDTARPTPVRLRAPRRDAFADVTGQLALWEAELAAVRTLPTAQPVRLEAAA